ncbi:serine/arginine repetitive matrix protein 2 [Euzebya tangerina]|uniref:serine/arginine repetitive matrix protein 2 n=1 Tax=Euzebya tangerina TaxID=591198 RepID=UPI000E30C509|nr:serine/arginine repetitive matrix protein 2 [Euzebya tangerina]
MEALSQPGFLTSKGLRTTLDRLHAGGQGAWRTDGEAAALLRYAGERYAGLARKFGQSAEDAAAAAFEAMLYPSTRTAADPWAVVTVAVRATLIAEHRAAGLLTSVNRARRASYSVFHDAERFSDRDQELIEFHPALQTADQPNDPEPPFAVAYQVADVLVGLGWPRVQVEMAVEYVCGQVADIGARRAAYESLRRDKAIRVRLDLSHECWIVLLRLTLGHPSGTGVLRDGLIARLLLGDSVATLAASPEVLSAPPLRGGGVVVDGG